MEGIGFIGENIGGEEEDAERNGTLMFIYDRLSID
jgi:hypothetical protein